MRRYPSDKSAQPRRYDNNRNTPESLDAVAASVSKRHSDRSYLLYTHLPYFSAAQFVGVCGLCDLHARLRLPLRLLSGVCVSGSTSFSQLELVLRSGISFRARVLFSSGLCRQALRYRAHVHASRSIHDYRRSGRSHRFHDCKEIETQ